MKKGLFIALVVVLIAAFAASALYLGNYFLEGKREEDRFNALASMVENDATTPSTAPSEETAAATTELTDPADSSTVSPYGTPGVSGNDQEYYTPDVIDEPENTPTRPENSDDDGLLPWYQELHDQNPDMVGWLQIDGTKINYPVMQTDPDNPNYYLYRDFDGNESVRGSIYAWEKADVFKPSDNITLFGHNMKDGSMFAYLGNYYNKKTWENNPLIFFDTLTESHVYKIFAVFKTSGTDNVGFAYHQMTDVESIEEFDEFVATCKELSFYDTGITPVYGDKLLCLSTCEYTIDNGRFVVAAVRIS